LSLAAGRFLDHQLYGLSPYDPAVLSAAVLGLALSALVATIVPALRASATSPMDALRAE
jgi:ABC-type lipoprotein release transport system permease subunit